MNVAAAPQPDGRQRARPSTSLLSRPRYSAASNRWVTVARLSWSPGVARSRSIRTRTSCVVARLPADWRTKSRSGAGLDHVQLADTCRRCRRRRWCACRRGTGGRRRGAWRGSRSRRQLGRVGDRAGAIRQRARRIGVPTMAAIVEAAEDADLGVVLQRRVVEREPGDEQRHREADAGRAPRRRRRRATSRRRAASPTPRRTASHVERA